MRVLVCGARDYTDRYRLEQKLDKLHSKHHFTLVIEGGAKGADEMAHDWAMKNRIPVQKFSADWKTYGRAAGPIRNKQMLDEGEPDMVVAFPKTILAVSKGTRNMVEQARKIGLPVIVDERI